MSWSKVDDGLYDHRKVDAMLEQDEMRGSAALGVWVAALSYSAKQLTEGLISRRVVLRMFPDHGADLAAVLVTHGLFDVDDAGWRVHDYLDYNPTAAQELAKRAARSEAGRRGGKASARTRAEAKPPANDEANASANDVAQAAAIDEPSVEPRPVPSRPVPSTEKALSGKPDQPDPAASIDEARARLKDKPVQQVFDAWCSATGRTERTVLDAKRRRIIEAALKSHDLADCLAAVTNIGRDEWAAGANDRGKPFNDIEHALGSAERIEKWRDWKPATSKAGSAVPDVCPSGGADLAAVECWGRAVVILRERPDLVTWLEGLHPHGFDGDTLVLGAPAGAATWLTDRWRPVFAEAAGCPVEFRACADGARSVAA